MIPVAIREPFWGAGSLYGWGKNEPGIGIDSKLVADALKIEQELRITIGGYPLKYKLHPQKVLTIGRRKWVKHSKMLYIIPINSLEIINKEPNKEFKEDLFKESVRDTSIIKSRIKDRVY